MTTRPNSRAGCWMGRSAVRAAGVFTILSPAICAPAGEPDDSAATRRAVAFLVEEVPEWPRQNRCFSCHNNGDGARALLVARQRGWDVPDPALTETSAWLLQPQRWERNGGNPDYSDRRLIAVQFSAALAALVQSADTGIANSAGAESGIAALRTAADTLASLQFPDGSWAFEAEGQIGSPIGYGRPLMTVTARDVLLRADPRRFAMHITLANDWLLNAQPRTVLDAAAVVWGLSRSTEPDAEDRMAPLLELLRRAQSTQGGWGPYEISAPEPFDTAIVMLALERLPPTDETRRLIADGRRFLAETQLPTGGWPATTRPAGAESYPQKLSTTAWATLALLVTEQPPRP